MKEILIFGERTVAIGAAVPGMPGAATESAAPPPATAVEVGTAPPQQAQQAEPFSPWPMLLLWGAVFVGMWFMMIRPQRKREKKMRELQSQISTGDNVVTSSGLFGKVTEVGEDCFVVEFGTNRGVRIPVLKADVVAVRDPKMTPQPRELEVTPE
ncbi:MAG: preprotein translocase subunit YajC [Defluviitaleaceae bacterium]|nr:preprotein translocase subunit YajC [Defluviitaleaceae bacterium]